LLRGASGSGKSSLLHLMAGLMLPTEGTVQVGDRTLNSMNDQERSRLRREHIGLIFQKLNLLSHLTVSENVQLSLLGLSEAEKAKRVAQALARVKITDLAGARASVLSGGEQQRVAVARVLAQSPLMILADEPTSSLDDENAAFVIEALKIAAQGKTLFVASHDDRLTGSFKDIRTLSELSK
jgi:putative ABC transport system ATP-binding protein